MRSRSKVPGSTRLATLKMRRAVRRGAVEDRELAVLQSRGLQRLDQAPALEPLQWWRGQPQGNDPSLRAARCAALRDARSRYRPAPARCERRPRSGRVSLPASSARARCRRGSTRRLRRRGLLGWRGVSARRVPTKRGSTSRSGSLPTSESDAWCCRRVSHHHSPSQNRTPRPSRIQRSSGMSVAATWPPCARPRRHRRRPGVKRLARSSSRRSAVKRAPSSPCYA